MHIAYSYIHFAYVFSVLIIDDIPMFPSCRVHFLAGASQTISKWETFMVGWCHGSSYMCKTIKISSYIIALCAREIDDQRRCCSFVVLCSSTAVNAKGLGQSLSPALF